VVKIEQSDIGRILASDEKLIQKALEKCSSHSERIYLLRVVCNMDNNDIDKTLNIALNTVEITVSRLRKLGFNIPDRRRSRSAKRLRERMKEILSSVVVENVEFG